MRDKGGASVHAGCVCAGAAKAGCSTALFSRQAGSSSLSESMKESEGSEVSQALTAASAKAPDDDEPASDAAGAGSSRPESMSPMPSEACTRSGGRRTEGREAGERAGGKVGAGGGGRAGGRGGAREPRALRRACVRACAGYGLGERGAARERRGCAP